LKKNHIHGGFFFTGEFYHKYPDIVKRLIADGHYVGSHSYGHLLYSPWSNRDSLLISHEQFDKDMLQSYDLMRTFGIEKKKTAYFIPPYEYYNSTIASWAKQLGLQIINFTPGTGSNADYTTPDMKSYKSSKVLYDQIMKEEKKDPHGLNGHFLMIHFGTDDARTDKFYSMMPKLIKALKNKGYRFVSVEEALGLKME
jgi:peptidoglycan/xylan/chitin deacetylase (PgdA/CDA1 family)